MARESASLRDARGARIRCDPRVGYFQWRRTLVSRVCRSARACRVPMCGLFRKHAVRARRRNAPMRLGAIARTTERRQSTRASATFHPRSAHRTADACLRRCTKFDIANGDAPRRCAKTGSRDIERAANRRAALDRRHSICVRWGQHMPPPLQDARRRNGHGSTPMHQSGIEGYRARRRKTRAIAARDAAAQRAGTGSRPVLRTSSADAGDAR